MAKKLGLFVKDASRVPIVDSLQEIKAHFLPRKVLVNKTNPLVKDAIVAIDNHLNTASRFNLQYRDVANYIAASTLSHLIDGWGYLSKAVDAHLSGNEGVAIHLAYYAELRSVMSFLAAEGIGVFNNKHLSVNTHNTFSPYLNPHVIRGGRRVKNNVGTHVFTWDALEKWCNSSTKPASDILKIFKVKGFDFFELTEGFHPSATALVSASIAKRWLMNWSFDVQKFRSDRELRNFVSYRPQSIRNFDTQLDFKRTLGNLYEIFELLSPLQSDPFHLLDRYLLADLLQSLHSELRLAGRTDLPDAITSAFQYVGATVEPRLMALLTGTTPFNVKHLIFSESKKREISALPVISRATLMLRIATGATSSLLKEAGITKNDLEFIWDKYGFNNGFWQNMLPVNEFYKLWIEVEEGYFDVASQFATYGDAPYLFHNEAGVINQLQQFNRAILWGI